MTSKVIAFDPGHTTGWCVVTGDRSLPKGHNIEDFGHLNTATSVGELTEILDKHSDVDKVIIEDYVILNKRAQSHSGSRVPAILVIGAIQMWCGMHNKEFVMQSPRLKPSQEKITQIRNVGAHKHTHWVDAYRHAVYYLIKQNQAKSALEIKTEREAKW